MAGKITRIGLIIAGVLFSVTGLIWTVVGNLAIGGMNTAIGMMFIVVGICITSQKRDINPDATKPSDQKM